MVIPKFGRANAQHCFDQLVLSELVRHDEGAIVIEKNLKTQSTTSQTLTNESHDDNVVVKHFELKIDLG